MIDNGNAGAKRARNEELSEVYSSMPASRGRREGDSEHRFRPSMLALEALAEGPRLLVAAGDRLIGGGDGLRDVAAGLVG